MTNSSNIQEITVEPKQSDFSKIDLNDFVINSPTFFPFITLIDKNGKAIKEQVPKEYQNNQIQTQQYLEQRVNGVIGPGEKIQLEEVSFTSLEDLTYYGDDKQLTQAVEGLIKARDSTEKPEVVESFYVEARNLISKINPPTKASLHLLYIYAIRAGNFYEKIVKNPKKAADIFMDAGLLMLSEYPKFGLYLIGETPKILIDNGLYQDSHLCFSKAIDYTLKLGEYEKALELLNLEVKQYLRELSAHRLLQDVSKMEESSVKLWGRICGIFVIKLQTVGMDIAQKYFKAQLTSNDNTEYKIPGKDMCENLINSFKENKNNLLENVKKSPEIRYLPGYMGDLINGLDLDKHGQKSKLNKKHSQDQL